MSNDRKTIPPYEGPMRLHRPRTRRDLIAQGFKTGAASVTGMTLASLLMDPKYANALSVIPQEDFDGCNISLGNGRIPFICFDLAGGANIAGSNVLVGGEGGQLDFIGTAGYSKQGLPGDRIPGGVEANPPTHRGANDGLVTSNGDYTDTSLGLAFHSESQLLAGILEKFQLNLEVPGVNGAVVAARSENDTGNNPHNPMYALAMSAENGWTGVSGDLLDLVGSRTSESGGNSMASAQFVNAEKRPTKIDRVRDVTGLVDVGDFGALEPAEVVAVMESVWGVSNSKIGNPLVSTGTSKDAEVKQLLNCSYIKSAFLAEQYPDPSVLDPSQDLDIVGQADSIFGESFLNREYEKTASVMKLVLSGRAGAGTITMGGYDYHTGDRNTGELRDIRAGRCIGACLEYARRKSVPVMIYVFSDGSVFSNGQTDESGDDVDGAGEFRPGGRGKGVWTGDSQQTASAFFLVYDPNSTSRPVLVEKESDAEVADNHQQIGYMRASGDVETSSSPAANNVNLLVETVLLNYLALHGAPLSSTDPSYVDNFLSIFNNPANGIRSGLPLNRLRRLTAFEPILQAGQTVNYSS